MSGGAFDYSQRNLAHELFGWDLTLDYGKDGFDQSSLAGKKNPMEHRILSELVWDVLVLIHSLDWYHSGDTDEETYEEDVEYFKNKWLNFDTNKQVEKYKEYLKEYYEELLGEIATTNN